MVKTDLAWLQSMTTTFRFLDSDAIKPEHIQAVKDAREEILALRAVVEKLTPYKMYSCGRSFLAINGVALVMEGEQVRDHDVLRLAGKLGNLFPEKYPYRDETGNTWAEDTLDAAIELITTHEAAAASAAKGEEG